MEPSHLFVEGCNQPHQLCSITWPTILPDVAKGLAFLESGIQHSFTFCLEKNCFNLSAIILHFNNVSEEE